MDDLDIESTGNDSSICFSEGGRGIHISADNNDYGRDNQYVWLDLDYERARKVKDWLENWLNQNQPEEEK